MEGRRGRDDEVQGPAVGAEQAGDVLRVVMTADNHLSAYTPKLSPQRLSERRQRLRTAFLRVVDEAIARRAHIFIQAGDLFDSIDPRNFEREFVAAQLVRLRDAGIRAFGVSGNHDTPRQRTEHGGYSPQGVYAQLGGLHYFPESHRIEPVYVETAGMRVAVAGLSSNPGQAPGGDPLDGVEVDDPDGILAQAGLGILVLHAAIEGHGFPGDDESIVRHATLESLSGFQVVLAGHVHAYARLRVGDKSVVVCGPTERMEFGEAEGKSGFAYLELTHTGLRHAEHIAILPQPRHVVTVRTTELWPQLHGVPVLADSLSVPWADSADSDIPLPGAPAPALAGEVAPDVSATTASPAADAVPIGDGGSGPSADPTQVILSRMEPYCIPDAMVRLCLEGPITREQYRALDLRRVWLTGQRRAFSFDLDESGLMLTMSGTHEIVARGERVAPYDMLEQVAREWMERAQSADERALIAKTRERVLASYEQLTGREAGQ